MSGMLQRWKNAVVHLECATDSEHFIDYIDRVEKYLSELDARDMSRNELSRVTGTKFRDLRFHGTALFFRYDATRYLLTVRHVLWDKVAAQREWRAITKNTRSQEPNPQRIFDIIFRVPTLDEVLDSAIKRDRQFLMNLSAAKNRPFTFSSVDVDLAVVALDPRDRKFADELESVGYQAITMADMADEPSGEGAEVFTVGFPSATALLGQMGYRQDIKQWASNYYSLPTTTFGRVSMLHPALAYFWVDMSIYPGNSGSPVVENGQLVGIVREQATVPIEQGSDNKLMSRIPFGKIIKAKYLKELIDQHIRRGG